MRKAVLFSMVCLVTLMIFCVPALADDDEEIYFVDMIGATATPAVAADGSTIRPSPSPTPVVQADGSVLITITAVGDVTIGNNAKVSGTTIFEKELKRQNGDINFPFRNIKDILSEDDLTIANFEGVLTTNPVIPSNKRENDYLFYADPSYTSALRYGSIEAVSLENNHVMDFGEDGYQSTKTALDEAGIVWSNASTVGVYNVNGVSIAMLSYQTFNLYDQLFVKVPQDVAAAKLQYDLVIVSFHWGAELDYWPNTNQQKLAKLTIDAGADLILGHHSHRINPIEEYNGKYIVYSLGNFSFAGNSKPSDMTTFIFQIRFRQKDGEITTAGFRIIPCRISSRTDYNDFTPTVLTATKDINAVLTTLKRNGANISNPVQTYPMEWE